MSNPTSVPHNVNHIFSLNIDMLDRSNNEISRALDILKPYFESTKASLVNDLYKSYVSELDKYFIEARSLNERDNVFKIINTRIQRAIESLGPGLAVDIAAAQSDNEALIKLISTHYQNNISLSSIEKSKLLGIRSQNKMLSYRGGVLQSSEVAEILGIKKQTVNDKRKRGELLGLFINDRYKYPVWQLRNRKIIPHMKDTIKLLKEDNDDWMILRFFIGENDYLLANCPKYPNVIDALINGQDVLVKKAVKAYFQHGTV